MGGKNYGHQYQLVRASLLGLPCALQLVCEGDPADSADHAPPLSRHDHVPGAGCCSLRPACMRCQGEQARLLSMETKRLGQRPVPVIAADVVQSVEWL